MRTAAAALVVLLAVGCTRSSKHIGADDMLTCATLASTVFSGNALTTEQGQRLLGFGKQAEDPTIRGAAFEIQDRADAADQTGVTEAIRVMTIGCDRLGIGPGQ